MVGKILVFLSTLNGSILELYYQDLYKLYELKDILLNEGISVYQESTPNIKEKINVSRLQLRN